MQEEMTMKQAQVTGFQNRKPRLPLLNPFRHSVLPREAGWIEAMLSLPGQALALQEYGEERLIPIAGRLAVAKGARRHRYMLTSEVAPLNANGRVPALTSRKISAVAALDVLLPEGQYMPAILETIYVLPEQRRRGYATQLVAQALADFPELALDGRLTDEGAAFFGYAVPLCTYAFNGAKKSGWQLF